MYVCVSLPLLRDPTIKDCFSSTVYWWKLSGSWSSDRNDIMSVW